MMLLRGTHTDMEGGPAGTIGARPCGKGAGKRVFRANCGLGADDRSGLRRTKADSDTHVIKASRFRYYGRHV